MLDLLVMGAGLSGLSAALTAAGAGLRVRVVAKGLGTLHWHAGTLDVLGYLPGTQTPVARPFEAIDALEAAHPYGRLGGVGVRSALETIVTMLDSAGLAFPAGKGEEGANEDEAEHNRLLPSAVGAARPTWRAPVAQVAGDLASDQPMLLVGLRGLRDFYPALIAEHLTRQGIEARAAWLPRETITLRRDSNYVHLAEALDDPAPVDALARALRPLLHGGERVGLPAILGLRRHPETFAHLRAELGVPVFEIPTLPPSVPGMRMHWALVNQLAQLGVRVEAGMAAIGATCEDGVVRSVETATSSRPLVHRAAAFLLATGGVLGGGIHTTHQGAAREVIFDLPVTLPQARTRWFRSELLDPRGQPVFMGGVEVNDQWQPIGRDGDPCYANLWAAGNGLANADAIRTRSVEGLAIATGVAAAQAIIAARA